MSQRRRMEASQASTMEDIEEEDVQESPMNQSLRFGDGTQPQTQASSEQMERSRQALDDLAEHQREELINNCVQFFIRRDKNAIKISDLTKDVTNNHRINLAVIEEANKKLRKIFGLSAEYNPSQNEILVVSCLPFGEDNEEEGGLALSDLRSDDEHHKVGLLIPVLSVIWMNGGTVNEDIIGRLFKKLDLEWDNKQEEVEGLYDCAARTKKLKLRDLVTKTWKQQRYLNIERVEGSGDQPQYEYSWGPRAEAEVDKMAMLHFVSQVMGDGSTPETWIHQFRQAQEQNPSQSNSSDQDTQ